MKKILFVCTILFCFWLAEARAPLESYKRYMIVLVHGIGANTLSPHDYTANPKKEEVKDKPRKSAIWDRSKDDMEEKNWQGNIGGNLQARGFLGHVVWYDFFEPWRSPIYDSKRLGFEESLSRYLGDRNIKESNEKRDDELKDDKYRDSEGRWYLKNPMSKNFGRTAQSYWLHEFFPKVFEDKVLDENDLVTYKGNNISYLELAQKDWESWYKLRNLTKDVDEKQKPKKYILIAHSMGGLTTRDYITGGFYKGDVDKLITLDSPHEGSAIANYVQYWHKANNSAFEYIGLSLIPLAVPAFLGWLGGTNLLSGMLLISTMPLIQHSVGSLITDNFLSGYDDNGMNYGIDVMALDDGKAYGLYRSNTKDFLKQFNQRDKLDDDYDNGYKIPYVRLVSTSGVPTPGGDGFHKGMIYPITSVH